MSILCWDFDGTITYAPMIWSNSVLKSLKEVCPSSDISFDDIRPLISRNFSWESPYDDNTKLVGEAWWDDMNERFYSTYIKLGIDSELARAAAEGVRAHIVNHENYKLYDDAIETLKAAADMGHTNIMVSNNYPDLRDVVEKLGITDLFAEIIVSGEIGYDKPRSEFFDFAKKNYKGERFIMIGDNSYADVMGGKEAGMTTIYVHRGHNENADYCFDTLKEVLSVI